MNSSLSTRPLASWPATVCALIAMAALFITGGGALALPLSALALLWTHFSPARLERESFTPWLLRLVAFAFVVFGGGARAALGSDGLMDARVVNLIGSVAAAELAIQHWRRYDERFPPSSVLLSSLVFLAASNTSDDRYVRFVGPLFITFLVFALRDLQRSPQNGEVKKLPRQRGLRASSTVVAYLVCVLVGGAAMHAGIDRFRSELMSLGMQFLRDRPLPQNAGISDRPRLSSRFETPDSPQRVLRIEGELPDSHLRAASFDFYSDGTWGTALSTRRTLPLDEKALQSKALGQRIGITRLTDIEGSFLFTPLNIAGVVAGGGNGIEGELENGPLRCDELSPYKYQVLANQDNIAGVPTHQGPLCVPPDEAARGRYLQLPPEIDPKVRDLARTITQGAAHPSEQAEQIVEYLMTNHRYSRVARRGGGDPVSRFLLEKRSAHCEFFAAATAVLLRCVGVPSRYVVGYLAHESAGEGVGIVRQRDAHAWAEAWIEGVGWVTVDGTPGDGRPDSLAPVPLWRRAWEWLQDGLNSFRARAVKWTPQQWMGGVGALVFLWVAIRWRPARRARHQAGTKYFSPAYRLEDLAQRFEKLLAQRGIAVSSARSWTRMLTDDEHRQAQHWAADYERVRFGAPDDEAAIERLEAALSQLETARTS